MSTLQRRRDEHHNHELRRGQRDAPHVEINLLGGFRVTVDGIPTPARGWSRRAPSSLVKILALTPGHRLHRERVMDLLWPDDPAERSAARLHKAAHFARRTAGGGAVVLRSELVHLFPRARLTVDALVFEQLARSAVERGDPIIAREALARYGGELLPADRYEDWAADRREALHLRRLDVLRVVGDYRELAELQPLDEEAHIQLMRRHIDAGDGPAAIRQCEHLSRMLDRELGVAPGAAVERACREARLLSDDEPSNPAASVRSLLAEMADLISRQNALLAEFANAAVMSNASAT